MYNTLVSDHRITGRSLVDVQYERTRRNIMGNQWVNVSVLMIHAAFQTRNFIPMLNKCWSTVCDTDPLGEILLAYRIPAHKRACTYIWRCTNFSKSLGDRSQPMVVSPTFVRRVEITNKKHDQSGSVMRVV